MSGASRSARGAGKCARPSCRSVTGAIAAAVFAVRSAIWSVVAKTIAGLNYIDATAASGLRFVGGKLRDLALYVADAIWRVGVLAGGRRARSRCLAWATC